MSFDFNPPQAKVCQGLSKNQFVMESPPLEGSFSVFFHMINVVAYTVRTIYHAAMRL